MATRLDLIRAISSEFVRRKLASISLVIGLVLVALILGSAWLTTFNAWLWLLVGFVVFISAFVLFIILMVRLLIGVLRPNLTKSQKASVALFVDKVERNLEHVQTPLIWIEFRVLRDLIWPQEESFIKSVTKDSTTLHKDFLQLVKDFNA